jgi:hypothetical protein
VVKPSLAATNRLICCSTTAASTFPQETTLDQFFDEAQWESYRKLGSHIGDKLFGAIGSMDALWTGSTKGSVRYPLRTPNPSQRSQNVSPT